MGRGTSLILAWLITILAASGLLALGYWAGKHSPGSLRLKRAQDDAVKYRLMAARQEDRANRLLAESKAMEERLTRAQANLRRLQKGLASLDKRTLGPGQAVVYYRRLVVAVEGISPDARRATMKLRILGGPQRRATLAAGDDLSLRLNRRTYRLVVRRIGPTKVTFSVLAGR